MVPFKHKVENFFFSFLLLIIKLTSPIWVARFGAGFGLLAYFLGIRRKVVIKNLQIAFGKDHSAAEINLIARQTYANMTSNMFEFLALKFIDPSELSHLVTLEGKDIMQKALAEGRGVVMAGTHFGNWELLSAAINSFAQPIYGYTGKQKNASFDNIINGIRQRFGLQIIPKSKFAIRDMFKVLRNKDTLAILGDLNVPHDSLFVDFFGKKASIGPGLATFTIKQKAPLLFITIHRTGVVTHHAEIIRLDYPKTGNDEQDIQATAQLLMTELENRIRQFPDHYFWFNRRWKTRPEDEKNEQLYD